jgi:hypothetical protein
VGGGMPAVIQAKDTKDQDATAQDAITTVSSSLTIS